MLIEGCEFMSLSVFPKTIWHPDTLFGCQHTLAKQNLGASKPQPSKFHRAVGHSEVKGLNAHFFFFFKQEG